MIVTWLGGTGLYVNAAQKTVLIDPSFETTDPLGRVRYPPLPFAHPSMLPPADAVVLSAHGDEAPLQKLRHKQVLRATSDRLGGVTVTAYGPETLVIEGDGVRVLHATGPVLVDVGPIDLAFLPFTAATADAGCALFLDALQRVKPQEAAPLGGGWAWLEPARQAESWNERLTTARLLGRALEPAHRLGVHLLLLEPGDQWSPDTGAIAKGLSAPWTDDADALRRYAAQRIG